MSTIDDDERLTPEEVEEEIADIYEEFNERKALRQDAFDAFMKIEPKQLVPDEALYREMRANYRDYFTGGMGAESVRDLLDGMDLEATAEELREDHRDGQGPEAHQGHQAPEGGRRVPQVRQQARPT